MALDVNSASREELEMLTGIGAERADAIIAARPFSTVDDLLTIPGIGRKNLDNLIRQGLSVGGAPQAAAADVSAMPVAIMGGPTAAVEAAMPTGEMDVTPASGMGEMEHAMAAMPATLGMAMPTGTMTAATASGYMPGETSGVAGSMPGGSMTGTHTPAGTMPGEEQAGSVAVGMGLVGTALADTAVGMALTGTWRLTFSIDPPSGTGAQGG